MPSGLTVSGGSSSVARIFKSGRYYTSDDAVGVDTTLSLTLSKAYWVPFRVPKLTTFDGIGIEVTTAAATSTVRLAIASGSTGAPGALVVDAGTVASTTTGPKEATISQALAPGLYFLGVHSDQNSVSVRAIASVRSVLIGRTAIANENIGCETQSSVTTTFPDPCVTAPEDVGMPKIMLRAA